MVTFAPLKEKYSMDMMGRGLRDRPRLPSISQTLDLPLVSGYIVICYRLCFDEGHIANRLPVVVMMVAGFPTEYNKYTSSDSTAPSLAIRVEYAIWVKVGPCQGAFNQTVWFKCKERHRFLSLYNLVSPPIQPLFPHVSPLTLSLHLEKKNILEFRGNLPVLSQAYFKWLLHIPVSAFSVLARRMPLIKWQQ